MLLYKLESLYSLVAFILELEQELQHCKPDAIQDITQRV